MPVTFDHYDDDTIVKWLPPLAGWYAALPTDAVERLVVANAARDMLNRLPRMFEIAHTVRRLTQAGRLDGFLAAHQAGQHNKARRLLNQELKPEGIQPIK